MLKPAARRYRGEQAAAQYIPFRSHVTENIISTENGEYVTTFRVRGRTYETASDQELIQWCLDLNHMLKQVGDEHVSFWTHLHHRKVDAYQSAHFPTSFARRLDENYAAKFAKQPTMANDLYLSVVYNPVGDATQRYLSKMEKLSRDDIRELQQEAIEDLESISSQIMGGMSRYGIERLGVYYRDETGEVAPTVVMNDADEDLDEDDLLDDNKFTAPDIKQAIGKQYAYSEPLELFSFLVNGEWQPVLIGRRKISETLQYNRTVASMFGDIIQIRQLDGVRYTAGIEIRDYEPSTEPGQLNKFLAADFEFVLTQSFKCMGQHQARTYLTRAQKAMRETNDLAVSQTDELSLAANDLVSGDFVYGWHHATLHVFGHKNRTAAKRASIARTMMNNCGVSAQPIGMASEAAYYARLPGNQALVPRPTPVTSKNFLSFSSFHNLHTGKPRLNPWGDAVAMLETTAGSPFHFNWHPTPLHADSVGKRPAGHTLFLGKTGEGKTTLMNALLTFSTKYKPRNFIFDRDQGMRQMVMALGGYYRVMREGEASGFQPLQMEPTRTNIAFVKRLVRVCAETTLGRQLDPQDVVAINEGVDEVMGDESQFSLEERTMTTLMQQVPDPERTDADSKSTLVELLSPWCEGGQNGWLFDNTHDELDMSVRDIMGFDLSEFIVEKDEPAPETRAPMLMYLLFRIRKTIDGTRPTIVSMDEFHSYLNDPIMDIEIKRGLKTDRKKDAIYVFATQEPNDAIESRIGRTVIQQIATTVMLANPQASHRDYVEVMKLTEEEYRQVASIPEGSRQFMVKQGSMSTMARLNLAGMDREISILSGTPDGAELCDNIIEELGTDDPDVWMPEFWKRQGIA
ncbi:VirB4 family type IV secretion/conjugal transfer ATPase [Salinicola sp. NYA28a]